VKTNTKVLASLCLSVAIFVSITNVDKWVASDVQAQTVYSVSDIPSEYVIKTLPPVPPKPSISPAVVPVVIPVKVAPAYRPACANGSCRSSRPSSGGGRGKGFLRFMSRGRG
jgi:hypothetical protein